MMKNKLLKSAYSPEKFREQGHRLIDELADHLDSTLHGRSSKVMQWNLPEDEYAYWKEFLVHGKPDLMFTEVLKHTTHVHHPRFLGHQISPTAPLGSLAGLIGSLLNNGMAVYEMGMAPSAIERVITEFICSKIGYDTNARGFLTSGGTLANLTALLSARKAKVEHNVWREGQVQNLGIMVSEEAHYCVDRAARIMGLGEQGIIKIPVTDQLSINIESLEEAYAIASRKGIKVFAIVGSAPSTASGIYDNLSEIAKFAKKHDLWFHVDGAHGGAAIFSPSYRYTVHGIDEADSIVIDGHKMMMMPSITTALLYKDGNHSYETFNQKADYLLVQSKEEDWYNLAKRTFECTKNMMSIQWFALLKMYGEGIFDEFVTTLYDLGTKFGELIVADPMFEIAITPMSNIVCFRYLGTSKSSNELNRLNEQIRQDILEDGEFYIVQTKIKGIHYLRTTIMNPFTTTAELNQLLTLIKKKATLILTRN